MQRSTTGLLFAFDVERSEETKSGFKPAERHFGSGPAPTYLGDKLYADLRIRGAVAALKLGIVQRLFVPGKNEKRYPDEEIWQGNAIREMLTKDFGIHPARVAWAQSKGDTGNAAYAMKAHIAEHSDIFDGREIIAITNQYHMERAGAMLRQEGVTATMYSAESLILMKAEKGSQEAFVQTKTELFERMNEPDYIKRLVADLGGVAQMRNGSYDRSFGKQGWK